MKWIDSHAHLGDHAFRGECPEVIARCATEAVGVVTIGSSLDSSRSAVNLAHRYRRVWASVGVHPHRASTVDGDVLSELRALSADPLVVAVGEIGLDYYRDLSPRLKQRKAFEQQLQLAADLGLPVCIHNRESTEDLVAILKNAGFPLRGVVHSFLGDRFLADEFLALGLDLGIGGPLTYPSNTLLREAVKHAPPDRLLLETDCPYLTPVPYRGRRNEPVYIKFVALEMARLKGVELDQIAAWTTANTIRLFGLEDR